MGCKKINLFTLFLLLTVLCSLLLDTALAAEPANYEVSTAADLASDFNDIKSSGAGEYTISLQGDIDAFGGCTLNTSGVVVLLIGNGHTIHMSKCARFAVSNGATLDLGDGTTALTIIGTQYIK